MTLANILLARERVANAVAQGIEHPEQIRVSAYEHWRNIASNIAREFPSDVKSLVEFAGSLEDPLPVQSHVVNGYMKHFQDDSEVPVEFRFSGRHLTLLVPSRSILSCPSAPSIKSDKDARVYARACISVHLSSSIGVLLKTDLINCSNGVCVSHSSLPQKVKLRNNVIEGNSALVSVRNNGGETKISRSSDSVVFVDTSGTNPNYHPDAPDTGTMFLDENSLHNSILIVRSPKVLMHREPRIMYATPNRGFEPEVKGVVPPPDYKPESIGFGEVICLEDFILEDSVRRPVSMPAGRYSFPVFSRSGGVPRVVAGCGYFSIVCPLTKRPLEYCKLPDDSAVVFGYFDDGRIIPVREVHGADSTRVLADTLAERLGTVSFFDDVVLPRRVISPSPYADLRARINVELEYDKKAQQPQTPNS